MVKHPPHKMRADASIAAIGAFAFDSHQRGTAITSIYVSITDGSQEIVLAQLAVTGEEILGRFFVHLGCGIAAPLQVFASANAATL